MDFSYKFALTTIEFEGGYVNHSGDIGGETKYGISKRFFPDEDIKNLTKERAAELYVRNSFYTKELSSIDSPGFAFLYFDVRVCGQRYSHLAFQNIINSLFLPKQRIIADGIWGPKTTALANHIEHALRVPVLEACLSIAEGTGAVQAMHTLEKQAEAGVSSYDFTSGYIKRCRERLIAAIDFERRYAL